MSDASTLTTAMDRVRVALELITKRGYGRDRELVGDFVALLEEFAKVAKQ